MKQPKCFFVLKNLKTKVVLGAVEVRSILSNSRLAFSKIPKYKKCFQGKKWKPEFAVYFTCTTSTRAAIAEMKNVR